MNLDELDPSPDRYEGLCAVQPDVALPGWESARRARQEAKRRARETEGAEGECARPSETGDQRPPVIRVVQGELHNATGRKRFWLAARATSFGMVECSFERVSRTLVEKEGRTVPEGTLVLEPAGKEWLQIELCRLARWERAAVRRDGSVEWVPCDAPMKVASGILADIGGWQVPLLTAVTEIPILRPDGSICAEPGYDEVTGLFFDPGGAVFPPISERPGRDDAMAALASLEDLLKDFPFVEPCHKSAALAMLLTGVQRRQLKRAPAFAVSAREAGTGKGLLVEVMAIIATSRTSPIMPYTQDEDEQRKRITASLLAGHPIINIDNVTGPIDGAALAALLTTPDLDRANIGRLQDCRSAQQRARGHDRE